MGVKTRSRLIAVLVALVMVFTSAVGVFAAGSPTKGTTKPDTTKKTSSNSISVVHPTKKSISVKATGKYKYKINNGKWKTTSKKTIKGLKKGDLVIIKTKKKTTRRWIKSVKITKIKKGLVKWKKVKGAKYYMVRINKDGKKTYKIVKGTKLKKGVTKGAKICVRPVKVKKGKKYLGALCKERKVK